MNAQTHVHNSSVMYGRMSIEKYTAPSVQHVLPVPKPSSIVSFIRRYAPTHWFYVAALVLVLIHQIFSAASTVLAQPIMLLVVMTLGMLHGCLDYDVARAQYKGMSRVMFSVYYTSIMLALLAVWFWSGTWGMLLLLVCTAWHFGQTDFTLLRLSPNRFMQALYGAGLVSWLIGAQIQAEHTAWHALGWMPMLTNSESRSCSDAMLVAGTSLVMPALIQTFWSAASTRQAVGLAMHTIGIFVIMYVLPMAWAFTLYFGFWHSWGSLMLIKRHLGLTTAQLFKKSAPYLGATLLIGLVLWLFPITLALNAVQIMVMLVASLTLPHAFCMDGLLRFRKN